MILDDLIKELTSREDKISSSEAFNIWSIIRSKYNSVETLQFYLNFIHDTDFKAVTNEILSDFKCQVEKLENLAERYEVKVPPSSAHKISISAQLDQVTDKFVFRKIYSDLIYQLGILNRAIISTTMNDKLRNILVEFVMSNVDNYEDFFKYGKLKGWTEIAPAYKTYGPPKQQEMISVSEANHLWDHINLRYDQLHLTMIYLQFVHDMEFKKILQEGKELLEQQAEMLKNKATEYEIPTPENPPAVIEANVSPEIMEDKFAYRNILKGIQEAIQLHLRAIIETTRNDSLREIFFNLYQEELDLFSNYLKYGKAKGWTHIPPTYK